MIDQKKMINNGDWKYLGILDACRYDYFSNLCDLPGDLKKVFSPAFKGKIAPTSIWYNEIFTKEYEDIIHISAHPRVNSKMEVDGFEGEKHFFKVFDLWDSEWNSEWGTVLPEDVTKRSLKIIKRFPNKRFVIHYMQPHTPYLSLDPPSTKKKRTPESRKSIWRKARNFVVSNARKILGDKRAVDFMEVLGLPSLSPLDDALRRVGEKGVRKAYRENLSRVLTCVEELV